MPLPFKTRKDCPRFKGWAPIDWDSVSFKSGDRYVEIKDRIGGDRQYPTPEKGYNISASYSGTCASNWNIDTKKRAEVYRPIPPGFTEEYDPCD